MNLSRIKKVGRIMGESPITVDINSPLGDAAEIMEQKILSNLSILP